MKTHTHRRHIYMEDTYTDIRDLYPEGTYTRIIRQTTTTDPRNQPGAADPQRPTHGETHSNRPTTINRK